MAPDSILGCWNPLIKGQTSFISSGAGIYTGKRGESNVHNIRDKKGKL